MLNHRLCSTRPTRCTGLWDFLHPRPTDPGSIPISSRLLTALPPGKGISREAPISRIEDPALLDLRKHLGRGPERNIFVTGGATLELSNFAVFDSDQVESAIITTRAGAERLARDQSHPHVQVIVAGDDKFVDLPAAVRTLRQQMGIRYLLCEGGPTLYGYLSRAALVGEKFLTISPVEAGQIIPPDHELSTSVGPARLRPTTFNAPGFTKDDAPWWTWMSCRKVGDHQFNRYRRKR